MNTSTLSSRTLYLFHDDFDFVAAINFAAAFFAECAAPNLVEMVGGSRVVSWYCVPRTGLLTEVGISTTIVRVRHDGKLHLGFVPQNCFFDVTDAASIKQAGIAIQENILIEYQ